MKNKLKSLARIMLCGALFLPACNEKGNDNSLLPLLLGGGTHTSSIELPKTGQIAEDSIMTGDDGDLQMGVAWPDPRFTDNEDGTITDNLTGLMWEQAPSVTATTWATALDNANDLPLGGYDDWRLPNRNELSSLIHRSEYRNDDWLNATAQGFSNIQFDYYWTSNSMANDTTRAMVVYLGHLSGMMGDDPKTDSRRSIACRGSSNTILKTGQTESYAEGDDGDLEMGVAWPSTRFKDNGNGTITDWATGLMWQQSPSTSDRTFSDTITYVADLPLGGYHDWRVPNVNELQSLMNAGAPAVYNWLNSEGFSNIAFSAYWSSTIIVDFDPDYALPITTDEFVITQSPITSNYKVIAVRDAW